MYARVWDGKNKQLETANIMHRIRETITLCAKKLSDDPDFNLRFKEICRNTNPALWNTLDAWRIMQSYQLIISTMRKRGGAYAPALKIPKFAEDAMWIYNNVPRHSHADYAQYHLTAADICLDDAIRKVQKWPKDTLQKSSCLTELAKSAMQGAIIANRAETLLAQSDKPPFKLTHLSRQVARCYHDLSRIFSATADYANTLKYACLAIQMYNRLPHQSAQDFAGISDIYQDLSQTFHFNDQYHAIFHLLSHFFYGSESVNIHQLMQLDFNYAQQIKHHPQYDTIWSDCLILIERYANHPNMPASPLKDQLQLDYHQNALHKAMERHNLEALEPGTPTQSPLPDASRRRNTFFTELENEDDSSELFIPTQDFTSSDEDSDNSSEIVCRYF